MKPGVQLMPKTCLTPSKLVNLHTRSTRRSCRGWEPSEDHSCACSGNDGVPPAGGERGDHVVPLVGSSVGGAPHARAASMTRPRWSKSIGFVT